MNVASYIRQLLSYEEYSFSLEELIDNLDKSETSIRNELSRLIAKKEIVNLRKGFYLIITPRYSSAQKLPIQLYCEKLFKYLNRNYYIALFSAAKIHGASHQQVQRDYVISEKPKLIDISKRNFGIRFFTASNWSDRNIQIKKSEAGVYKVSSPALTIVDLISYQTKLGGLSRILSSIEELTEELTNEDLALLLNWYPNQSTLQRFGYIMENLGVKMKQQDLIYKVISTRKVFPVLLSPKLNQKPGAVSNKWKVDVNVKLESDL